MCLPGTQTKPPILPQGTTLTLSLPVWSGRDKLGYDSRLASVTMTTMGMNVGPGHSPEKSQPRTSAATVRKEAPSSSSKHL